jgi:hypothetical protein
MNHAFQELKDQRDKYLQSAKEIDSKLNDLESNSMNEDSKQGEAFTLAKEMLVNTNTGNPNVMSDIYFLAEYIHHCKNLFSTALSEIADKREKEMQYLRSIYSELKK